MIIVLLCSMCSFSTLILLVGSFDIAQSNPIYMYLHICVVMAHGNDACSEQRLPSTLLDQARAFVADYSEVDDADLLQAVIAVEQTEFDAELSDNELMSAVAAAEQNC